MATTGKLEVKIQISQIGTEASKAEKEQLKADRHSRLRDKNDSLAPKEDHLEDGMTVKFCDKFKLEDETKELETRAQRRQTRIETDEATRTLPSLIPKVSVSLVTCCTKC